MLIKAPFQANSTLRQFYGEAAASDEPITAAIGRDMLALVEALEASTRESALWAFTSLYSLCIQEPTDEATTIVRIWSQAGRGYRIEAHAGSEGSQVAGRRVSDVPSAVDAVLSALRSEPGVGERAGFQRRRTTR